MRKYLIAILLAIGLMVSILPMTALGTESADVVDSLTYTIADGVVTITNCADELSGDVVIPDTIEGCHVTSIAASAFSSCYEITSLYIPDSVTAIGEKAFQWCTSLREVHLPASLTKLESYLFYGCGSLEKVHIPASVEDIDPGAFFWGYPNLESITVESGNPNYYVEDGMLIERYSSSSSPIDECIILCAANKEGNVFISANRDFGSWTFSCCPGITGFTVDESHTLYCAVDGVIFNVSKDTLYRYPCGRQGSYTIPEGTTYIFGGFGGAIYLTDVVFPSTMKDIFGFSFYGCTGLTDIEIRCVEIYQSAFRGCSSLKTVCLAEGVEVVGMAAFESCNSVEVVMLPSTLKSLGSFSFLSMKNSLKVICYNGTAEDWANLEYNQSYLSNAANAVWRYPTTASDSDLGVTASDIYAATDNSLSVNDSVDELSDSVKEQLAAETYVVRNLALLDSNGVEMEMYGEAEIQMALPSGFASAGCQVFRVTSDGELEKIEAVESNGQVTFTATELGTYVLLVEHTCTYESMVYRESTCETAGEMRYTCTVCGDYYTEVIAVTGHTWGEGVTTKEPGLFEKGYLQYSCTACGATTTEEIASLITYEIADGKVTITKCDSTVSGEVIIPQTIEGYPVTKIANSAFISCKLITYVEVPEGVISLGNYTFQSCTALEEISLPETLNGIGQLAFYKCTSLKSITIPQTITRLHQFTFAECSSLESIVLPQNIILLGTKVFNNCTGLKTVYFQGDYPSTDETAFTGVTATVYFPIYNTTWYESVRRDYGGTLTWVEFCEHKWQDATCITPITCAVCGATEGDPLGHELVDDVCVRCEGQEIDIVIASGNCGVDGDNVTWSLYSSGLFCISGTGEMESFSSWSSIPWSRYMAQITAVIIEEGVTNIGSYSFWKASELTTCQIASSVVTIGEIAFRGSGLTEIIIPDSVQTVDDQAFKECASLVTIQFGRNVTSCGSGVFSNCTSLTKVHIPANVSAITYEMFKDCTALQKVTIEDGITAIGKSAFYGCTALQTVEMPASITTLGTYAFYNCDMLNGIVLGENITVIPEAVFKSCNALTEIVIPASVTQIDYGAFSYCVSLSTIRFCGAAPVMADTELESSRIFYNVVATVYYPLNEATWTASNMYSYGGTLTWVGVCEHEWQDATCTAPKTCSLCGSEEGEALGHKEETVAGTDATCTETGLTAGVKCSVCDEVLTAQEEIPALGHTESVAVENEVAAGCTADGSYDNVTYCTVCNTEISRDTVVVPATGHSYTASVTTAATCTTAGEELLTCSACGESKTQTIDALGHDYSDYVPERNGYETATCCRCGTSLSQLKEGFIAGGLCGSLMWELEENGTLTISGTGDLAADYSNTYWWKADDNKDKVTNLVIEEGVTSIGDRAFYNCSSLVNITIPDSVTSIGGCAFWDCSSLTSITISDSITSIDGCAFTGCSSLTGIWVDSDNGYYSSDNFGVLFNKDKTKLVAAPGAISGTYVIPDSVASIVGYAFYGCSSLTSITIPDSITSIGQWAFSGCSGLTNVTIPDSVTSIGKNLFHNCSGLTSITIPDSVTSIGDAAFAGCSSLTGITIPDSVTSIGTAAFYNCSSLTSIAIPDGITRINDSTFENCSSLTNITIPDGVTYIGVEVFYRCESLTSITIPDGVTSIGRHTFYCCNDLTNITIPDSVTSIGQWAFYCCYQLTNITIPDSVTSIGERAFYLCYRLTEIYFEGDAPSFGNKVFADVAATAYYPADNETWTEDVRQNYDGTITWVEYCVHQWSDATCTTPKTCSVCGETEGEEAGHKYEAVVTAPTCTAAGVKTYTCSGCGYAYTEEIAVLDHNDSDYDHLCDGCGEVLTECKNGGNYVCSICGKNIVRKSGVCGDNLTWTWAGDCVLTIFGTGDMYDYTDSSPAPWSTFTVKTVVIESGVTSIGDRAFYDAGQLASVSISNTVKSIGVCAFSSCDALESVEIPESVTLLSGAAFSSCAGLKCVVIPNSVTTIENSVFRGCISLTDVVIPTTATSIGNSAFYGCEALTEIVIPDSVATIGDDAFGNCYALASVTIGSGVTSIGDSAFGRCSGLTSVYIGSLETWINIAFGSYNSNPLYFAEQLYVSGELVTELVIPDGITSIEQYAFAGWAGMTALELPDSLVSIGWGAFEGCANLTNLVIPDSVTTIDIRAFKNCAGLISVIIGDGVTKVGNYAFSGCTGLTSVTIGTSVNSVGSNAFENCTSLGCVTFTGKAPSISSSAFMNVTATCYYHKCDTSWKESVWQNCVGTLTWVSACVDENNDHLCDDSGKTASDHSYGEWTQTKAPTCTEAGSKQKACACGDVVTEEIPAAGHAYESVVTAPTCTEDGYTTYTCSGCGASYVGDTTAALGHTAGEVVKENETTTSYESVVYCSVCGAEMSRETVTVTPDVPVASLDGTKVVFEANGCTITRVYVFYIGDVVVENIQSWSQIANAAASVEVNPYSNGYEIFDGDAINSIDLPKNGSYVLRMAYTDAEGNSINLSQQIDVDVERVPVGTVSGTKLVFNENYGTTVLSRVYVFYVGDASTIADIQKWNQLESAAAAIEDSPYSRTGGFKTFDADKLHGILLSKQGDYVLRMVYTDANGASKTLSQVVTLPYVPTATLDEADVIIDQHDGLTPVQRVYVFYVGDTVVQDLNNFNELVNIGLNYTDVNGKDGYTFYNADELDQIKLPYKGNYILRIQYLDGANNNELKTITQQLTVDFTVSIVNGIVRFDKMDDVNISAVHVFYVGDSEINDVNSWNELVQVGLKYTDVNGSYGYRSHTANVGDMNNISPTVDGNYVLRITYTTVVDGKTETYTLSKRFTLEKGPVVELVDGKLTVDTRDIYTIDTITVFYVGDQTVGNPVWNNCVKAAANIDGSPYGDTGYKALTGMDAITNETLTVAGNYILRVSYKDSNGKSHMMIVEITV